MFLQSTADGIDKGLFQSNSLINMNVRYNNPVILIYRVDLTYNPLRYTSLVLVRNMGLHTFTLKNVDMHMYIVSC